MAKRPVVIGVVVVALAGLGGGFYLTRGGKKAAEPAVATEDSKKPERKEAPEGADNGGGGGQDLNVLMDDDREGKMVLEGIVVDRDGQPVPGASVTASTNPPRTIKSGDDGTFAFDKLVGRPYTLVARAPDGVAGPVTARLTEKSDPVTLRLMPAASVEVTVVSAADKKPISGANVELRDLETITGTTDADGKVMLASVAPGGYDLVAWAPGHAKAYGQVGVARQSGDAPVVEREQIELRAGAPVAGRVIDAAGKGVAGALVTYQGTSRWGVSADPRRDAVTSDKDGAYRFEAMPSGTFRFDARHKDFAPGSTGQIVLDGQSEKTGVDITVETGATLAGRVESKAGTPVGYATVRVAAKSEGMFQRDDARQTFTDEAGHFELTGLPRRPMDVVALHETGASDTVVADLTNGDRMDLIVKLDFDGTISGVVVDSAGEPVAEASVFAFPDFRKAGGGDRMEWRLRGRAEELTDAGGRFTLRGLRPGSYMLRANRPGAPEGRGWLREPASADVGDTNVKIVLPADGGVKGKVVLAGGSAAPSMFTVGFGMGGATPFSATDGSFQLDDIPPGEYSLQISGPEFDRKAVQVKIEADKVTDAGTITVAKGRTVSGRVLDASGQPVAGAVVFCGRRVMGDGSKPSTRGFGPGGGGTKTATSDEQGTYTVYGVGPRDLALIADHETLGRSTTVAVGPGTEPVTIDLTLQPFGALEGVVTKNGAPLEGVMVNVTSKSVSNTNFGVASGPDGAYRFDRLAPDAYQISAVPGRSMRGMTFHSKSGVVKSGQTTKLDLTVDEGGASIEVTTVKKDGSGPVNFTYYRATSFPVTATMAKALDQEITAHDGGSNTWVPGIGGRGKIEKLVPGTWTICTVPFPAEVSGMSGTFQYLEREGDNLPIVCVQKQIVDGEQSLEIPVDLPPFVPEPQGT